MATAEQRFGKACESATMKLISRYAAAVKRHLPDEAREDIAREIASSLEDELDELEAACGKPLTEEQVVEVLRAKGHPMQVAAAYRGDRSLIGPLTLPIYVQVLKAGFALITSVILISWLFFGNADLGVNSLWGVVHDLYWSVVWLFAWTTFAFFLMDSWIERANFFSKWDPSRLRPVPEYEAPISGGSAIAETVFGVITLMLLTGGVKIDERWINIESPVTVVVTSAVWTSLIQAAVLVTVGLGLLGFVDRIWTRAKLLPFAVAQLIAGVGISAIAVWPGALAVVGEEMPKAVSNSILYTFIFIFALLALRNLGMFAQALIYFRRLSISSER
jgi:hypothetical protein